MSGGFDEEGKVFLFFEVVVGRHILFADELVEGRVVVGEEAGSHAAVGGLEGEDSHHPHQTEHKENTEGRDSSLVVDSDHLVV